MLPAAHGALPGYAGARAPDGCTSPSGVTDGHLTHCSGSSISARVKVPSGSLQAAAALAAWLVTTPALADPTKEQCIDANAMGQHLRHDSKLAAARAQLQACAVAACPSIIRSDCIKRLDELDKIQPAIVFEAKDASGNDLSAVQVTMDGAVVANKLDGAPLTVDPGEHVFVFTAQGQPPVTKRLVVAERGEVRTERVVIGAATPLPPSPAPASLSPALPSPAPTPSAPQGMSTLRAIGLVSGGVGLAGIGVGSVFGILTGSAVHSQNAACASPTSCSDRAAALSDHSTWTTDGAISTVAFVAGGALLAAGVTMFVLGGSHSESATGLVVLPALSPAGAGISAAGAF
jgi:hypothetical protein